MLYMYCERAVQNRQDDCAVHRRTASLQYDGVLYIQDGTCCTYKTTSRHNLRLEVFETNILYITE